MYERWNAEECKCERHVCEKKCPKDQVLDPSYSCKCTDKVEIPTAYAYLVNDTCKDNEYRYANQCVSYDWCPRWNECATQWNQAECRCFTETELWKVKFDRTAASYRLEQKNCFAES